VSLVAVDLEETGFWAIIKLLYNVRKNLLKYASTFPVPDFPNIATCISKQEDVATNLVSCTVAGLYPLELIHCN
jgi:hypothetical protein